MSTTYETAAPTASAVFETYEEGMVMYMDYSHKNMCMCAMSDGSFRADYFASASSDVSDMVSVIDVIIMASIFVALISALNVVALVAVLALVGLVVLLGVVIGKTMPDCPRLRAQARMAAC